MAAPPSAVEPGDGAWIARLWMPPAAIALARPWLPSTDSGGSAWPTALAPQQMAAPDPAWIAQL